MNFHRQKQQFSAQNAILEASAVLFNLLFTWLYLNSSDWCFLFGVLGPICLGIVCYQRLLFAEVGLQVVYLFTAVLGFLHIGGNWNALQLGISTHITYIILGLALTWGLGLWLSKRTKAKLPYIDSFTTIFGVLATIMMMFLIREAFLYFIFINTVSIVMYTMRKMYFGAFMFLVYLLMSIDGFFQLSWFS